MSSVVGTVSTNVCLSRGETFPLFLLFPPPLFVARDFAFAFFAALVTTFDFSSVPASNEDKRSEAADSLNVNETGLG